MCFSRPTVASPPIMRHAFRAGLLHRPPSGACLLSLRISSGELSKQQHRGDLQAPLYTFTRRLHATRHKVGQTSLKRCPDASKFSGRESTQNLELFCLNYDFFEGIFLGGMNTSPGTERGNEIVVVEIATIIGCNDDERKLSGILSW